MTYPAAFIAGVAAVLTAPVPPGAATLTAGAMAPVIATAPLVAMASSVATAPVGNRWGLPWRTDPSSQMRPSWRRRRPVGKVPAVAAWVACGRRANTSRRAIDVQHHRLDRSRRVNQHVSHQTSRVVAEIHHRQANQPVAVDQQSAAGLRRPLTHGGPRAACRRSGRRASLGRHNRAGRRQRRCRRPGGDQHRRVPLASLARRPPTAARRSRLAASTNAIFD